MSNRIGLNIVMLIPINDEFYCLLWMTKTLKCKNLDKEYSNLWISISDRADCVWGSSIADTALILSNTSDRSIAWTIPKLLTSVQIFLLGTKLI